MQRLALDHENPEAHGEWLTPSRRERLGDVSAPTLVLVGELDQPGFRRIARFVTAEIPGARFQELPGVAHLPPMEDPVGFADAVIPFLVESSSALPAPRRRSSGNLYRVAMTDLPLVSDMQASAPPVELALSRAGVTGVHKAIRIRRGDQEILMAAEIDCTVDLARDQKGVHMSRFPELFDQAIDEVVLGEGLLVETLAHRIASQIVERQRALRAEVRIVARWPVRRRTPVTELVTQEMVSLIGMAAVNETSSRRVVGVEATGINACPCAQGLVRAHAAERLAEAGFGEDVDRILDLVPIATHNQRGRGTLLVGTTLELDAEDLFGIVERSMSAPVYELLKRPDELFVVEHAHLRPRFVEDSVRIAVKELLDTQADLDDGDFVLSRQVNLETIHDHDVVAERWGTVGELRGELTDGLPSERQTTLEAWLSS
jgi:GTP cyclohydrolase IV